MILTRQTFSFITIKVLHLIGYAVQEQSSGFYPFITFYERASKWGILSLMEELINSVRVNSIIKYGFVSLWF